MLGQSVEPRFLYHLFGQTAKPLVNRQRPSARLNQRQQNMHENYSEERKSDRPEGGSFELVGKIAFQLAPFPEAGGFITQPGHERRRTVRLVDGGHCQKMVLRPRSLIDELCCG